MQRYDSNRFKATKTDEGFLIDSPIVARTGIQVYYDANGKPRRELRLPDEVFNTDALSSMKGKPITVTHKGEITAKNFRRAGVGTVLSEGKQDGETVRADIIIQDQDAISKAESGEYVELSLGYKVDLEEVAGEWNGQKYDAIQRNIRVNHLSLVKKARAGSIARLNLDGDQEDFTTDEGNTMAKVRLDSGLEYEAAPEVIQALEATKGRADAMQSERDAIKSEKDMLQAKHDAAQAKVDGFEEQLKKAREDGAKDAKARADLETEAGKLGIKCDGLTDKEVKVTYVKKVRGDSFDVSKESDAYINAAYDIARADSAVKSTNMQEQRRRVNQDSVTTTADKDNRLDSDEAYKNYMKSFGKKEGSK
ncbi:MAG: DUF2213 domain-containing protein [Vibrio sp.]